MFKLVGTLAALVLTGAGFSAAPWQNAPATSAAKMTIPAETANTPNPAKPTEESIARAKKIYKMDCAMCHGDDGGGKGEIAVSANYVIQDYRNADTLKNRKDGEIFYIIQKGVGNMPPEEGRAKTDDVWNLVVYLRSFSDPSVLPKK